MRTSSARCQHRSGRQLRRQVPQYRSATTHPPHAAAAACARRALRRSDGMSAVRRRREARAAPWQHASGFRQPQRAYNDAALARGLMLQRPAAWPGAQRPHGRRARRRGCAHPAPLLPPCQRRRRRHSCVLRRERRCRAQCTARVRLGASPMALNPAARWRQDSARGLSHSACGRGRTARRCVVSSEVSAVHSGPARRRGVLAADFSPE